MQLTHSHLTKQALAKQALAKAVAAPTTEEAALELADDLEKIIATKEETARKLWEETRELQEQADNIRLKIARDNSSHLLLPFQWTVDSLRWGQTGLGHITLYVVEPPSTSEDQKPYWAAEKALHTAFKFGHHGNADLGLGRLFVNDGVIEIRFDSSENLLQFLAETPLKLKVDKQTKKLAEKQANLQAAQDFLADLDSITP